MIARPRLNWIAATVTATHWETSRTKTLLLDVPGWPGHQAGQHVDVRLTADDGYQAQRSYSIASAPEQHLVALTVERLDDGEVSPYLTDELREGDQLELRGPIGGWFTWESSAGGPLFLLGGGSGIVPVMAMLRHRRESGSTVPTRVVYSARSIEDVIYRSELEHLAKEDGAVELLLTLTRSQPAGWTGLSRRIDRDILASAAWPPGVPAKTFICGPTPFVESVAGGLVGLGQDAAWIKTERFGPTGG